MAAFPPVLAGFTAFSIFIFVPHDQSVPVWRITENVREVSPYRPDVRYLALYRFDDLMRHDRRLGAASIGHPLFRPGNIPMLAGLSFVNGYSPMAPRGLRRLLGFGAHGHLDPAFGIRLLKKETRPGALLEHLGVDGLVLHEGLAAMANVQVDRLPGWKHVLTIDGEVLLERTPARTAPTQFISRLETFPTEEDAVSWVTDRSLDSVPFFVVDREARRGTVSFCDSGTSAMVLAERLSARLRVSTAACAGDSLLLLRRPWFPGYRARAGEQDLRLVVADLIMPAAVIPPRFEGEISIEYRPRALWVGSAIALAAVLICGGLMSVGLVRRFTRNAADRIVRRTEVPRRI